MDWAHLLEVYGYYAIIIGTFFEGETILLLGAYAVQQETLDFTLLILSAMLGGFLGDQFYYQVGSRFGHRFIKTRPQLEEKFKQSSHWIDQYPTLSILFMRFAWGLRTVIPISFGLKKYPLWRYMVFNLLACFLWAFIIVSVGLKVSHWIHQIWQNMSQKEENIFFVFCALIIIFILSALFYKKRFQKSTSSK